MLQKFLLGAASTLLLAGAANAESLMVTASDGNDDPGDIATVGPAALAAFGGTVTGGGIFGPTDSNLVNRSVAHRFTGLGGMGFTAGTLTIQINDALAGSANDRLFAGFGIGGTTLGSAYTLLGNPNVLANGAGTYVLDLAAAGFLSGINSNGFFDVIVTDDTNIDFFQLSLSGSAPAIPLPAALPLMATALLGGSVAMRRRRKTA